MQDMGLRHRSGILRKRCNISIRPESADGSVVFACCSFKHRLLSADSGQLEILQRFLNTSGPVTEPISFIAMLSRSMVTGSAEQHAGKSRIGAWAIHTAIRSSEQGQPGSPAHYPGDEYVMRGTLEAIHRRTMTLLRREVKPVPFSTYADFLAHWQHLLPDSRLVGSGRIDHGFAAAARRTGSGQDLGAGCPAFANHVTMTVQIWIAV